MKAGVEDGEGSPMTDVQAQDGRMGSGKERIEGRPEDHSNSKVELEGSDDEQENVVGVVMDDCELKWDNWQRKVVIFLCSRAASGWYSLWLKCRKFVIDV